MLLYATISVPKCSMLWEASLAIQNILRLETEAIHHKLLILLKLLSLA
jgi:hypothetical protein